MITNHLKEEVISNIIHLKSLITNITDENVKVEANILVEAIINKIKPQSVVFQEIYYLFTVKEQTGMNGNLFVSIDIDQAIANYIKSDNRMIEIWFQGNFLSAYWGDTMDVIQIREEILDYHL
ncbi:hypothetical protein NV379_10685 [Paenibacillus sp. N1-5-1-14]|uniref:hypothetical protein n=1 Tax=Paenibacillus radicibacter TaxID=2972488 RepID=UPI0021590564|nr:hypothetical protein [Paenibacillus radicibacter]MCR8643125.1 hypothetical protein [Paenibacillus radicibacter]